MANGAEGDRQRQPRIGGVDLDTVAMVKQAPSRQSPELLEMQRRLATSSQVFADNVARGDLRLEEQLTAVLNEVVAAGDIGGLVIGSDDGLVVAQSDAIRHGDVLAAIASQLDGVVARAQREGIVKRVEEMSLRGSGGARVVIWRFPEPSTFSLILHATKRCRYHRLAAQALHRCGALLDRVTGRPKAASGGEGGS